jgi:hypothetical protein
MTEKLSLRRRALSILADVEAMADNPGQQPPAATLAVIRRLARVVTGLAYADEPQRAVPPWDGPPSSWDEPPLDLWLGTDEGKVSGEPDPEEDERSAYDL